MFFFDNFQKIYS